ncbi:hypothetical protein LINPERHAP2_LOCUS41443 [Linum perenne]
MLSDPIVRRSSLVARPRSTVPPLVSAPQSPATPQVALRRSSPLRSVLVRRKSLVARPPLRCSSRCSCSGSTLLLRYLLLAGNGVSKLLARNRIIAQVFELQKLLPLLLQYDFNIHVVISQLER